MFQSEKEDQEFAHPYFLKGQEHLLEFIKRKVSVGGPRLAGAGAAFLPSIKSEKVGRKNTDLEKQEVGGKSRFFIFFKLLAYYWKHLLTKT